MVSTGEDDVLGDQAPDFVEAPAHQVLSEGVALQPAGGRPDKHVQLGR
jgi:hypothetical protein